jgi:hypothetical protein
MQLLTVEQKHNLHCFLDHSCWEAETPSGNWNPPPRAIHTSLALDCFLHKRVRKVGKGQASSKLLISSRTVSEAQLERGSPLP